MATRVRTISVNLTAGTAQFFKDLDSAAGKIREFGKEGVSSTAATAAGMHLLEGNIAGTGRTIDKFLESVLGVGEVFQKAFPVVGVIAAGGVIVELSRKAYDFYKNVRDASDKATNAFRELGAPLRLTNDELAISNQRLENEIAKLEGHHENTLQLALLEAKKAADDLADSLDKDLKSANRMLEEQRPDFFRRLMGEPGGVLGAGPADEYLGGKSGFGGLIARQQKLRETTSPEDFPAAQDKLLEEAIAHYDQTIAEAKEKAKHPSIAPFSGTELASTIEKETFKRNFFYDELQRNLQQRTAKAENQTKNTLDTSSADSKRDRPFDRSIADQAAQITLLQDRLQAVGKGDAAQLLAKAFGEAGKEIQKVNDGLAKMDLKPLSPAQRAAEQTEALARVSLESEVEWQTKFQAGTVSIDHRIKSLDLVTAAIGKGYEAAKQANVETQLMQEYGEHYGDTEWLGRGGHQAQLDARRGQLGGEFDSQRRQQTGRALYDLNNQIDLERVLAATQRRGAEAVREATLAMRLRQLVAEGATRAQIQAEIELFNAQRANASADSLAKLDERIGATQRMTAAILQSAAAERQAAVENEVAEARRAGAGPDEIDAIRRKAAADYGQQLASLAVQADRVRVLGDQIQKLEDARALAGDTLAIEIQLRDLENQRITALAQESLGLRGARDGVRAFFIEMQADAESSAKIIYDALNSSLDRISANLGKLFTGQKTDWAKSFQQLGEEMVQSSVKSMLHQGLGTLGKLFGVDVGQGKPDGSAANPLWVRMAGGSGGAGDRINIPFFGGAKTGVPSGVFQGGNGMIMSLFSKMFHRGGSQADADEDSVANLPFFGGAMAVGGDVDPGKVYWTGEDGPEPFIPSAAGRILPSGSLGGDTHLHYTIDARGADLGVENRIARAIESSHRAAVATAVQVMHERSKRVPGGK